MNHGVDAYFVERARCAKRVAMISVGLGALLLAPLIAIALAPANSPLRDLLKRTARFGYEGPDQYVRRIMLQQIHGSGQAARQVGAVVTRHERRGGKAAAPRTSDPRAHPVTQPTSVGLDLADADMSARAVSRLANVPVVQSTELVIEHAATPVYPPAESEKGIEGKVTMQALIDTTGRVVEVQLLATTGIPSFERSAEEAVWLYRFRPYRPSGQAREVYAIFRFTFRIL